VISALADAGFTDVCLVIGPEHGLVRDHFERQVELRRVRIHFAVQQSPLGSADAVLAAEAFAQGGHVVVVNSDNYYPIHTLRCLSELGAAGVAAFERDALLRLSNIDAERIAKFAVIQADDRGMLQRIVEKPDPADLAHLGPRVMVGMNSWSLPPEIYRACRAISPSVRGELELPHAVQYAHERLGVEFHVLPFEEGVLDLSQRGDIASVAERLRDVVPHL
jgi:dTDP-glucose pyrophosphorylase